MTDVLMKKLLITGFEPFGDEKYNPSIEAVKRLPDEINGTQIIKMRLPVIFGTAGDLLLEKISAEAPDAVICVGLAGGRKAVTPEMVAVNLKNARIPDNAGQQPVWEKIEPEGEDGLFSTLPIIDFQETLEERGIPAEISYSAGTYVCNEVMYRLLSFQKKRKLQMSAGFIHVPYASEYISEGKEVYSMPLEKIVEALFVCIQTVIRNENRIVT